MENILWYKNEAKNFEEALPIGNGTLGAMVYGKTDVEKISLNHDTLWSGKPKQIVRENAYNAYKKAQRLTLEGDLEEAEKIIASDFTGDWTQSYLPMGSLYIKSGNKNVSDYKRLLDMENALVVVSYKSDDVFYKREYLVCAPDDCIAINLTSTQNADYEFNVDCELKNKIELTENSIILKGICPSNLYPHYHNCDNPCYYDGGSIEFTTDVRIVSDGHISIRLNKLVVENSKNTSVFICAKTSYVDFDKPPINEHFTLCLRHTETVYSKGFDIIKDTHTKDFSRYYNRVSLDINSEISNLSTKERLMQENKDLGLIELLFNFGRYLIISSSREGSEATNLQGIWNESFQAPWSSNYTVNINTQMNYWPVLICNLCEFNQPIIDLAKKISITGKKTAKDFYNGDGFVAHHNIDLWGHSTPVGMQTENSVVFAFWCMSSGWICRHVFEHYEYINNLEYLKNTAYPIIKEAVKFYLSVLIEQNDKLVISPSTSPENIYKIGEKCYAIAKWTAMAQEIILDLFLICIKCCDILKIDDDLKGELLEKIEKINTFKIGSCGQLLEWDDEYEECDPHHRHCSHLYGLYPGELFTKKKNSRLYEACKKSLEIRGDDGTGWSLGWKVNLWAKLKDGNHALKIIERQLKYVESNKCISMHNDGGTYANMFDAHPPFQIDGNFGVTAGIAQMFLQCEDNKIKILPALPTKFINGRVFGLLAKGGIVTDIVWEKNKFKKLILISPIDQSAIICVKEKEILVELKKNTEYIIAE